MWWCFILHEQQLIIVTLRNNRKNKIVKHNQGVTGLVYNHPAVSTFSEILISKCPSRAFMHNNGSMKELCAETVSINGKCQVLALNFQRTFQ